MAVVPFFTKPPLASFTIGLDFTDELPATGVTLTSGTASARLRKTEADATSVILSEGTTITVDVEANTGKILVSGGVKFTWYEIVFAMTCSNGHVIYGTAVLFVE